MNIKYSPNFYHYATFLDQAIPYIMRKMEKLDIKVDDKNVLYNEVQRYLMTNEEMTQKFNSFQSEVMKVSSSNKEQNRLLVESWAKAQSIEDPEAIEKLAEAVTKNIIR